MPTALHFDIDFNQLKSWIERISHAMMIVDERGIVVMANHSFQRLVQYPVDKIEGRSVFQVLAVPYTTQSISKNLGWIQGKLRRAKGECIQSDIYVTVKKHCGQDYYVFTLYPRWHMGMLEQMMSNIPIGILQLDADHQVIELNQAACQLFGIQRSVALYQQISDLCPENKQFIDFLAKPQLDDYSIELQWQEKYLQLKIVKEDQSVDKGYYLMIEDMTQIRLLEQQLKFNNRLATVGQIAAGSAHEIRNPLTSIKGFLQVLGSKLDEFGHKKEQGYINIMLEEISRINHLVGELLQLSKSRNQDVTSVQISQVMREILPIIKNEAMLHNIHIQINYQVSDKREVLADGKLLKQVFLNICKNGIEAMKRDGKLTISLMQKWEHQLIVEFHDTGPGISQEVRKKIFEPFFTTKENGTGLGLPICKQIMKEIGGKISVRSSKKGTIFRVRLPLVKRMD